MPSQELLALLADPHLRRLKTSGSLALLRFRYQDRAAPPREWNGFRVGYGLVQAVYGQMTNRNLAASNSDEKGGQGKERTGDGASRVLNRNESQGKFHGSSCFLKNISDISWVALSSWT